ncbi:MAG: NAD(P)H-quinone oxidoreductase subunit 4, partial [Prochlorotrichaceae cyanobacterium]
MTDHFPWLTAIVLLPLVASLLIPVLPDKTGKLVRWYALGIALADFALMCYAFWMNYEVGTASFQMTEQYAWVPQIGLNWTLSVDGVSMPLVLLAGLVTTLAILAAWQVDHKPRLFYFLMLVLYAAQIG